MKESEFKIHHAFRLSLVSFRPLHQLLVKFLSSKPPLAILGYRKLNAKDVQEPGVPQLSLVNDHIKLFPGSMRSECSVYRETNVKPCRKSVY